jgi:hypothetical protein
MGALARLPTLAAMAFFDGYPALIITLCQEGRGASRQVAGNKPCASEFVEDLFFLDTFPVLGAG